MSKARGPYRVDPLGYKKKAMQQAMEALKESIDVPCYGGHPKQEAAYHALQEALANEALDKKAENARELGLDYEPAKYSDIVSDGGLDPRNKFDKSAQQEPVAWMFTDEEGTEFFEEREDWKGKWTPLYTSPPAQQEPVYWQWRRKDQPWSLEYTFNSEVQVTTNDSERRALYTSPPAQRTWVGLNDDELADFWFKQSLDWMEFARVIEDALRSKNT